MEGVSNGGMLYHEVQESKLCAVHCVNTVLQGPFFSEVDLAALASDLDCKERQMMTQVAAAGDFLSAESHNVSLGGDFSIQVLQKALEVWDLQVIPLDSPVAEPAQIDPDLENAFICHLHDHWFCIRKVNGEWYNFDSLYAAPEHLSKFYLAAYLDSLRSSGWSIFLVRGSFPTEFPISSSEASNGYGQWLLPEDAERITKSCNSMLAPQITNAAQQYSDPYEDTEDEDLKAAIAASLMDSSQAMISAEAGSPQNSSQAISNAKAGTPQNSSQAVTIATAGTPQTSFQAITNVETGTSQSSSQGVTSPEGVTPQNSSEAITSAEASSLQSPDEAITSPAGSPENHDKETEEKSKNE